MRELYCYYRVRAADAPALQRGFDALRQSVGAAHPGVRLSLLRRDDPERAPGAGADADDAPGAALDTWMEIHRHGGADLDAALATALDTLARQHLGPLIVGERHLEWFRPVA